MNKENGNGVGIKKQILDNDKRKVTIARLVGVWGKAIVITMIKEIRQKQSKMKI